MRFKDRQNIKNPAIYICKKPILYHVKSSIMCLMV